MPRVTERLVERDAQRLERSLQQALVVGLAWREPGSVVVVGEIDEELDGFGAEAGEGLGRGRHLGPRSRIGSRLSCHRPSTSPGLRSTLLAQVAISARRDAPSLARMCSTWLLAVFGAMPRESAISAFVRPLPDESRHLELARRQRAARGRHPWRAPEPSATGHSPCPTRPAIEDVPPSAGPRRPRRAHRRTGWRG